jgi:hypothetical protein
MKTNATMLSLLVLAAPAWMMAQDTPGSEVTKPQDHFYNLNLTVAESDSAGKVTNTRSYTALIETTSDSNSIPQQIRTGSRIPIATASEGKDGAADHEATQFQYIDLGVNFDVRHVKEVGEKLSFSLQTEVSSLSATPATGLVAGEPVIRQNKWNSNVLIPLNKATVVYSADDLEDKGKMQVELTATRID